MKQNPYSFKLCIEKGIKESILDLKTNRSCDRNSNLYSTSRSNLPKDHANIKASQNALSTSRKTSISLLTSRGDKNTFESLKNQLQAQKQTQKSIIKSNQNQNQCSSTTSATTRHKTSMSQTTNLSAFSQNNHTLNRPARNTRPKSTKFSFTKQPPIAKQNSDPQFQQQPAVKLLKENGLKQLNIQRCESKEVNEIDINKYKSQQQQQYQQEQQQVQILQFKEQMAQIEKVEQQEIQIELDLLDMTPSMSELRKRLDSQQGSMRDSNIDYSFQNMNRSKESSKNKQRKQQNFQSDQILGDSLSVVSFECDDQYVGIELNKQEKSLDDKLKESQLVPTLLTNELNIYSKLEFQLMNKQLEQSTIERKVQKAFLKNQIQKKKEESIGSVFLIEYNRLDKAKIIPSAHKTISIIVFDEINEEEEEPKQEINNPQPLQTNAQVNQKPKRGSIFLHKGNLNFAQQKQTQEIKENQKNQETNKQNIKQNKLNPYFQIMKRQIPQKEQGNSNESCNIF